METLLKKSFQMSHSTTPLAVLREFGSNLLKFIGPGYLVAVGYLDPGNWATDLAGS
jgi:manganese transport protein